MTRNDCAYSPSSGFGSYVGQISTGYGVMWTPVKMNGHPAPGKGSLACLDCGTAEFAVSKSDLANLEKVTPLRQNESFKQDQFDKPGRRQTVGTISLRING